MSNYTPTFTNAAGITKDTTHTTVTAADIGTEHDAIAVAVNSKLDASGGTDLAVADGGTGASTAAGALSNLGGLPLAGGTMTGDITMSAASIIEAEGAAVSSATTPSALPIWATDGNTIHVTGTTTITGFAAAPQAGAWMKVIFDGALTLTHGANLNLPGSASITTAANDWAFVYADATTLFRVVYFKADGTAVVSGASGVTSVSGTAPVASTGGATPAISMAAASSGVNGYMTGTYATKLDGIAAGATVGISQDIGSLGVGAIMIMYNGSGGSIATGATVSGGAMALILIDSLGVVTNIGGTVPGTWRNINGNSIINGEGGNFQRIA